MSTPGKRSQLNLEVVLKEIVGESLDNGGALSGLDLLVVGGNEDSLIGLDADGTGGALLGVDGARIGLDGHHLVATNADTGTENGGGVSESVDESLAFTSLELEKIKIISGKVLNLTAKSLEVAQTEPSRPMMQARLEKSERETKKKGNKLALSSSDELGINVSLPRHI